MNIWKWEKKVSKKYKFEKITDFNELKYFLADQKFYQDIFCPGSISEDKILDSDFYAAYVFNEHEILQKEIVGHNNSGWTTTIVLTSIDKNFNITNYYVLGLNGFSKNDIDKFFQSISLDIIN